MGRKRLLAILAGVVAAVGLQVAPATALDLHGDLDAVKVEASLENGVDAKVEAGEDVELDAELNLDPDEDAVKLDGKAGEEDLGDATKDVTDTVNDTVKSVTGSGGGDGGDPGDDGDPGGDDAGGEAERDDVQAAGEDASAAPEPRQRVIVAPRELTYGGSAGFDILAGRDVSAGVPGSGSSFGTVSEPEVAPGVSSSSLTPLNPMAAPPRTAELATQPIGEGTRPADVALRLLAALMVAGAGTVWHIARKELSLSS